MVPGFYFSALRRYHIYTSTCAPASFSASNGLVSSTCSKPSSVRIATFLLLNVAIIILIIVYKNFVSVNYGTGEVGGWFWEIENWGAFQFVIARNEAIPKR